MYLTPGLYTAAHLDYLSPLGDSLVHLQDEELLVLSEQVVGVAVGQGHLETLVKQEMLQEAVHVRVLCDPYLVGTISALLATVRTISRTRSSLRYQSRSLM